MPQDPGLLSSVGLRRQDMGGEFSQVRMCSGISGIRSEAPLRQLGYAPAALGLPESHFPWGPQDACPKESHSCPRVPWGLKIFQAPFSGFELRGQTHGLSASVSPAPTSALGGPSTSDSQALGVLTIKWEIRLTPEQLWS